MAIETRWEKLSHLGKIIPLRGWRSLNNLPGSEEVKTMNLQKKNTEPTQPTQEQYYLLSSVDASLVQFGSLSLGNCQLVGRTCILRDFCGNSKALGCQGLTCQKCRHIFRQSLLLLINPPAVYSTASQVAFMRFLTPPSWLICDLSSIPR